MKKKRGGRPRLYETPMTTRIAVNMTAAQRLELRRVADLSGTGMGMVIREAVNCYVNDYGDRLPFRRRG